MRNGMLCEGSGSDLLLLRGLPLARRCRARLRSARRTGRDRAGDQWIAATATAASAGEIACNPVLPEPAYAPLLFAPLLILGFSDCFWLARGEKAADHRENSALSTSERLSHRRQDPSRTGKWISPVRYQHVVQHKQVARLPRISYRFRIICAAQLIYYRIFDWGAVTVVRVEWKALLGELFDKALSEISAEARHVPEAYVIEPHGLACLRMIRDSRANLTGPQTIHISPLIRDSCPVKILFQRGLI